MTSKNYADEVWNLLKYFGKYYFAQAPYMWEDYSGTCFNLLGVHLFICLFFFLFGFFLMYWSATRCFN